MDVAYLFPIGVWEKILMYIGCQSWGNLAKSYDFIQDVIQSIKSKEIVKCKRSAQRMPFEYFLELSEVPGILSNQQLTNSIRFYVNHWKFQYPDKIKMNEIPYSTLEHPLPVDHLNISGRWLALYIGDKITMVHLDTHEQHTVPSPHSLGCMEKVVVFLKSSQLCESGQSSGFCAAKMNCWCKGDLGHDFMQILIPRKLKFLQFGPKCVSVHLHSLQTRSSKEEFFPPYFHVTSGKFRLSFSPSFQFSMDSFDSHVKNPSPGAYVFEGEQGRSSSRTLIDVSLAPLPPKGDKFRAIILFLDKSSGSYRLLFLKGPDPKPVITIELSQPLSQYYLFRGCLLIGLCPNGSVGFYTHSHKYWMKSNLTTQSFTSLDLRGNLLVIGTRHGELLIYRLHGKPSNLPVEMKTLVPKRLQVTSESIYQVRFVPSERPEVLILTGIMSPGKCGAQRVYHAKLFTSYD